MTLSPGFQVFTSFWEAHEGNRKRIASTTARRRSFIAVSYQRGFWISA
jgi:hypothetical protein